MNKKCLYFKQIKHIQLKIHQHPEKRLNLEEGLIIVNGGRLVMKAGGLQTIRTNYGLIDKGGVSWDFLYQE